MKSDAGGHKEHHDSSFFSHIPSGIHLSTANTCWKLSLLHGNSVHFPIGYCSHFLLCLEIVGFVGSIWNGHKQTWWWDPCFSLHCSEVAPFSVLLVFGAIVLSDSQKFSCWMWFVSRRLGCVLISFDNAFLQCGLWYTTVSANPWRPIIR